MKQAWRAAAVAGGLAVFITSGGVAARAAQGAGSTVGQTPDNMEQSVPQTPEEHLARAAEYKEKAAAYRREADDHRKMLADYKAKQAPGLETKLGQEPPWVKKMRKHCESYITAAKKLALEAEQFAEFHRMRGEEMRGK